MGKISQSSLSQSSLGLAFVLSVTSALAAGCYSGLDGGLADSGADSSAATEGDSETDGDTDGLEVGEELPAPTTRFFRLTHLQWENTVRDLFYMDEHTGLSSNFRADPNSSGYRFDNNALALEIDQALWSGYQRAAIDAASIAISIPAVRNAIVTQDGDAQAFVRDFGLRAYRRPLSDAEATALLDLFAQADTFYDDASGFDAGVRMVVETILQTPMFLYRVEHSEQNDGPIIRLDNYEVAQRLSYFLWDSMPDQALFELAAESENLGGATLEQEARRLLQNPKARGVIQKFHDVVFEAEGFEGAAPSPAIYPNAPENLGELAREEFELFIEDTVLGQAGGVRTLLTSSSTFVNADLAALYGIEGNFGAEFEAVTLDPAQRKGVLTQTAFLVANATGVQPDPIQRGVFISRDIACANLPAPPDVIPPLPVIAGKTNREAIEELTEVPGSDCAVCHSTLINPFGFPFENYDSTGSFRLLDSGISVDPSTTVRLDGAEIEVNNAIELIDALAASQDVHRCYMKHWVELAAGQPSQPEDDLLIDRLGEASFADEPVQELLVQLVTSQPFLTRSAQEMD